MSEAHAAAFACLVETAQGCRVCPRMEGRRRVLGAANGPLSAAVCFIAEAPGRLGGDRTDIPLCGDQSGRNFERLLAAAGLDRSSVFITNAVLCNPRAESGVNRPPSKSELQNCSGWLRAQIALVDAAIVVTLGAVALAALHRIERHGLTLRGDAGRSVPWNGRLLVPLYHPSPRAGLSRSYADQDEDFRRLGELLVRLPS